MCKFLVQVSEELDSVLGYSCCQHQAVEKLGSKLAPHGD